MGLSAAGAGARALLAAALCAAAPAAGAHDFRIQPDRFHAEPGARIGVRLYIGDGFGGMPRLRDPAHIRRFFVRGPGGGAAPVPGERNRMTVGEIGPLERGAHILGYESAWIFTTIPADIFEAYLTKEGFGAALAARSARGEAGMPGREAYARSAKAVVHAGGGAEGFDAVLGLPLELTPEQPPAALRPGATLAVRLLLHGAPLAGAAVTAYPAADPGAAVSANTDSAGRAELLLLHAGPWLARAVHMRPAAPEREGADWESLWASLAFAVPEAE